MPDTVATAKSLLAAGGPAALATLGRDGAPFCSFVALAPSRDLSPILLLSALAVHTRNLEHDARASLLVTAAPEDSEPQMATIRLTLVGTAAPDADPALRDAYLARHPDSAAYAGFTDFRIFRFSIAEGHLVAGFGRIETVQASALTGGSSALT
jgi:hypothetical protein